MVKVIGHRGAAGLEPENTLRGFRRAMDLGVDAVECDVHLTRDGHVVVMHDPTVDRTTGGAGAIARMSLADIRALDTGKGEPPPTLEELLQAARGRCQVYCELKAEGTDQPAAGAVLAQGMEKDVVFISFRLPMLANVKRRCDRLRVGALVPAVQEAHIAWAAKVGAELIAAAYEDVCLATVEQVHQAGLAMGVWTPNRPDEMQAMLWLGADQITTDRPDVLLDLLRHQGRP